MRVALLHGRHSVTTSRTAGIADDGEAKGKATDTRPFGLSEVLRLPIGISADEDRAMSPPAPAALRGPASGAAGPTSLGPRGLL